jgi:hypothetical protein
MLNQGKSMPTYTRLEVMNLGALYADTQDLSTIRGGGLALLYGPDRIFPPSCSVSAASQATAREGPVPKLLELGEVLQHGTVTVQTHEGNVPFDEVQQRLAAKCRFEQVQSATLQYPTITTGNRKVCDIDHVRPGTLVVKEAPEDKRNQSTLTNLRRTFGRERRQRFYSEEVARAGLPSIPLSFTSELEELGGNSPEWGSLQDRIAVIHLDGDKLGSHFASLDTWEIFRDQSIQYRNQCQARFLRDLLSQVHDDPDWRNGGLARLETLLWGGDELRFVVPAWKAFDFLRCFYRCSANWKLGAFDVSHSAGVVFAYLKTPIRELGNMAKQLAEFVKDANGGSSGNRFACLVLKSVDELGPYVDGGYMQQRHPFAANDLRSLTLNLEQLTKLERLIRIARAGFPRRQVYALARLLARGLSPEEAVEEQVNKILADVPPETQAPFNALGQSDWFHLSQLWDHLAPEKGGLA